MLVMGLLLTPSVFFFFLVKKQRKFPSENSIYSLHLLFVFVSSEGFVSLLLIATFFFVLLRHATQKHHALTVSRETVLLFCLERWSGLSAKVQGVDNDENSAASKTGTRSTSNSKPNIFFFLIDDMGFGDIGYQSTDLSKLTPNLDALAAGGVKVRRNSRSSQSLR